MPTPGLSLVGFMEEPLAFSYLRQTCVLADQSDTAVRQLWLAARERLGAPIDRAGKPEIKTIPPHCQGFLKKVEATPTFGSVTAGMTSWSFALVEVGPLLAYQFHVDRGRPASICDGVHSPPSIDEMLGFCLPVKPEPIETQNIPGGTGILLISKNLNMLIERQGTSDGVVLSEAPGQQFKAAGVFIGARSGLVQVVRYNGRCYLKNGFHRAFGMRLKGATHIPCLLLDTDNYAQVGAQGAGNTFDRDILESENPPTCGHFVDGRATEVTLRSISRIISVTWSEHTIAD